MLPRDDTSVTSTSDAFSQFLTALELTKTAREAASKQHTAIRENLQKSLPTSDAFLTGSYARHTAIRPLDDIDMFVVLDPRKLPASRPEPKALLRQIAAALKAPYADKTVSHQTHSVHIEFVKTGIAYDIVPALPGAGGDYEIPDRDASKWIRTNPKKHKKRSTEANERAGKMLIPLIKAIKHANRHAGKPARSFHIETLAWTILTTKPQSWLSGLRILVDGLHAKITGPCPDPAGLGPNIEPDRPRVLRSAQWLATIQEKVAHAEHAVDQGDETRAHQLLGEVFGPTWPA